MDEITLEMIAEWHDGYCDFFEDSKPHEFHALFSGALRKEAQRIKDLESTIEAYALDLGIKEGKVKCE